MVTSFVVLACLATLASAAPSPYWDGRIVNGSPIDITEVPYQVAVGNSGSIWCGGSIISPRYIATAAHCFDENAPVGIMAFVGMTRLDAIEGSMLKPVRKVSIHPSYDKRTHNYDIAILELENNLAFSSKVQPVGLPELNANVPTGAFAYASGWGRLSDGGESPVQLQGVGIQLLKPTDCGRYNNFDDTYMLCAGALDGSVDTCQGDSGGPLVYDGILYGVTSFGIGCAVRGYPGVYANVANLRDYVTEITGL